MKKVSHKDVLKRAKQRSERRYKIVSYSIDKEALDGFNKACIKNKVKPYQVLEEFMKLFAAKNA